MNDRVSNAPPSDAAASGAASPPGSGALGNVAAVEAKVAHQGVPTAASGDDALMARFCGGDETAFVTLYDRYAPQLEIFLRRLVRDPTLAEDLLQTTFLSFVRARGRYVPSAGVRGWIYAIAANAGRDALRRRGIRREAPLDVETIATYTGGDDPELTMTDPNVARAVDQALAKLPADQREAVLLHKLHGLSFPEVAAALGTTVGAAKVRAHRGYQRLKVLLAAWEDA